MASYTTKQGDMWDMIAYTQLGDCSRVGDLLQLNPQYSDVYIFPAGISLELPSEEDYSIPDTIPPWKQVAG